MSGTERKKITDVNMLPKECFIIFEVARKHLQEMTDEVNNAIREMEMFTANAIAEIDSGTFSFPSITPAKNKKRIRRTSKLNSANASLFSQSPSLKECAKVSAVLEPIKESVKENKSVKPPTPVKPVRRLTRQSRLATVSKMNDQQLSDVNVNKGITQSILTQRDSVLKKYDKVQVKLEMLSPSSASLEEETDMEDNCIPQSRDNLQRTFLRNDSLKYIIKGEPCTAKKKGRRCEEMGSYESIMQPIVVLDRSDNMSPPYCTPPKHVSTAFLTLSQERRGRLNPMVVCSPLNKKLSNCETSRQSSRFSRTTSVLLPELTRMSLSRSRTTSMRLKLRASKRLSQAVLRRISRVETRSPQSVSSPAINELDHETINEKLDTDLPVTMNEPHTSLETSHHDVEKNSTSEIVDVSKTSGSCESNLAKSESHSPVYSTNQDGSSKQVSDAKTSTLELNRNLPSSVVRITGLQCGSTTSRGLGNKLISPQVRGSSSNFGLQKSARGKGSSRIVTRTCTTPSTPSENEKRLAIAMKELKAQNVLKRRDSIRRKETEEKKRKREERLKKALKLRQEQERLKMAKLKEQTEEAERAAVIIQMRKDQEEQERQMKLAEQRRLHEQRFIERQQMERAREIERQLQAKEKEQEKKPLLENKDNKEEEKNCGHVELQKAPTACQSKPNPLLNKTITIDLNRTVVIASASNASGVEVDSYDLTPQRDAMKPSELSDPNNYNIEDIVEDDSTDDDECPKKQIPAWADGLLLKAAAFQQAVKPPDYDAVFPPNELLLPLDLPKMFTQSKKNKRIWQRTSSAVWTSPILKQCSGAGK